MARYPVTREGVEQLRALASSLRSSAQDIEDCCSILLERIGSLSTDNSSEILSEIENLAHAAIQHVAECKEPIELIGNKLSKLSSSIEDMLGRSLFKSERASFLDRMKVDVNDSTSQSSSSACGDDHGSEESQRQRTLFPTDRGDER